MTEYREFTNAFGSMTKQVKYYYDAQNRRMKKEVFDFENSGNNFGRFFVYSGENIFAEFDNAGNHLLQHLHSPMAPDDILATYVTPDGAAAGLAQASGTYWYHKDALGSITDITANPAFKNTFAFTGREINHESGLMYYRARYYDPSIGRFLQQDPYPGRGADPITSINKIDSISYRPYFG